MARISGETVRVRRTFLTSPERLFDLWTDPSRQHLWVCPEGTAATDVAYDCKVGGAFSFPAPPVRGAPSTTRGVFKTVEAPSRLTFSWERDGALQKEPTMVSVELLEVREGTEVTIRHGLFQSTTDAEAAEVEWNECLDRLEALAGPAA